MTVVVPGDAGRAGRARVVAYIDGALEPAEVRAWMRREAPAWMVPSRVIAGALPHTPAGKIDHGALARRALPAVTPARGDPLECALAALWCEALGIAEVTGERFRDAGGDSLAQLTLLAAAAARGIALEAAALAGDPTFAELVARVRGVRVAPLTVAECEARGEAALAARRDPDAIAHAGTSGAEHRIAGAGSSIGTEDREDGEPGGAVLITGATGRLGGALVRAWRSRDPRPVVALVRAPDVASARRRVASDDGGVEVICGDVARPYFGLAPASWHALAGRVSAVIHAAAHIDLAASWDAHAAANVDGTAEVARFVAARPGIAWHHVSTLSVFVGTNRKTGVHRETASPVGEAIAHGGYAQTKIAAEAIARASRGRAAPTTILRLGLLAGEAPRATADDQLAMTLRGLARLGAVPAGAAPLCLDITPIAHAAAAVAALAGRAERARLDDTHHIAGARAATFGELVAGLCAAGVELVELAPATWAERARDRLVEPDVAMAYLSLGRMLDGAAPPCFDLFLATGAEFDVARTHGLLAALGVVAPAIDLARIARIAAAALRAEASP